MKTFIYFSQGEWRTFQAEELPVKPEVKNHPHRIGYMDAVDKFESEIAALKAKAIPVGNSEILEKVSLAEARIVETSVPILEWPGTVEVKEILGPGWVPSYNDPDNSGGHPNAEPMEIAILKLPA